MSQPIEQKSRIWSVEPRQQPSPQCNKTKEMILDFRRLKPSLHCPININGEKVEIVQSFKYLGVHISHKCYVDCQHLTDGEKRTSKTSFLETVEESTTPTNSCWWTSIDQSLSQSSPIALQCGTLAVPQKTRSLSSGSLKQQRRLPALSSLVWRTFTGHVAFGRPKPSSETLLTQVTTLSLFYHLENVTEHCISLSRSRCHYTASALVTFA